MTYYIVGKIRGEYVNMVEVYVKCFRVEKDVWDRFYARYRKNSHEELRRILREELRKLELSNSQL